MLEKFKKLFNKDKKFDEYIPRRDYSSYNNYNIEFRTPMIDYSGMFEDCRFKLLVINELIENGNPSFKKELNILLKKYEHLFEDYYATIVPEIYEYFENVALTKEYLMQVEYLCFDGGNEIYDLICYCWDGEDSLFDITSIKGYELLPNLKSVFYSSLCEESLLYELKEKGIIIE